MSTEPRAVPLSDLSGADGVVLGCEAIANAALTQVGADGVVSVPYPVRGAARNYSVCSWFAASAGGRRSSGRLCLTVAGRSLLAIGNGANYPNDVVLGVLPAGHLLSPPALFDSLVCVLKAHGHRLFCSPPTRVQDCDVLTADSVGEAFAVANLFQMEELVLNLGMFHREPGLCDAVWTGEANEQDVFNAWWQAVSVTK